MRFRHIGAILLVLVQDLNGTRQRANGGEAHIERRSYGKWRCLIRGMSLFHGPNVRKMLASSKGSCRIELQDDDT